MKKTLAALLAFVLAAGSTPAFADPFAWGSSYQGSTPRARNIRTDTTNFDNNLSATDVDVQAALETLDEMAGGGGSVAVDGVTVASPDFVSTGDIDFVATGSSITGNVNANSVALTTDTTGNYVTSVATSSPLSGGAAASEGATLTLSIADADDDGTTKGAAAFTDADFDAASGVVSIVSGITRDTEWDTVAEINTATTDGDFAGEDITNVFTTTNTFPTGNLRVAGAISGTINFTTASTTAGAWLFPGTAGGTVTATSAWDTEAEVEAAWGSVNIIIATEMDTSLELKNIIGDETGSGALVFGTSPGFTTAANPVSDDGATLGTTSLKWSDLFLASGSIIDWNSGDLTLTHAANTLTLAGGDLVVPTEVYDATGWNSDNSVPTKDAVRDKIESLSIPAASGWTDNGSAVNSTTATDNFIIGSTSGTAGTSGAGVLVLVNGTAPASSPADSVQFYSEDVSVNGVGDLLLHFNGTDTSTTFTDSSANVFTVTAVGNAQLDTAQQKFGTASFLGDGTGDYATVPDGATWNLNGGSAAFTIDFWVRWNSVATTSFTSHQTSGSAFWEFYYAAGTLRFRQFNGSYDIQVDKSWTPSTATWYHVAVIRGWGSAVNDYAITVDGTQVSTTVTDSTAITDYTGTLNIAGNGVDSAAGSINGWMDEFRIYSGAFWTANFTAPVAEHANTASAEAKVRDEAGNVTTISPHNVQGIPGARLEKIKSAGHIPVTVHHTDANGNEEWIDTVGLAMAVEKLTGQRFIFQAGVDNDWKLDKKDADTRTIVRTAIKENWNLPNLNSMDTAEIDRRAGWIYEKARREAKFQAERAAAGTPLTDKEKPPVWLQAVVDKMINRVE